jgi:hypothetical protein
MQDRLFIRYDDIQRSWIDELNEKLKAGEILMPVSGRALVQYYGSE